jgi:hypothetical protein
MRRGCDVKENGGQVKPEISYQTGMKTFQRIRRNKELPIARVSSLIRSNVLSFGKKSYSTTVGS